MEKNMIYWAIGITLLVSVIANIGGFTGNAAKNIEPSIYVVNPIVSPGYNLDVVAAHTQSLQQEFKIFEAVTNRYTGNRFFSRLSKCERQKTGDYTCNLDYKIPSSMPAGNYYIQAISAREVKLVGNKAPFTITG